MRRSQSATDADSPILNGLPSPNWTSLRSPLSVVGLTIGVLALAFLVSMLAAGSDSAGAVTVWVLVFAAFALPFVHLSQDANWHVKVRIQAWLRRYAWDLLIILALLLAFLAINLHDLQDWYYSAIGDEFLFYEHAKRITEEGITRPFSQEGVYNHHPVMSSVYQAVVMWVFGVDYLGWTFSSLLRATVAIPGIYRLGPA